MGFQRNLEEELELGAGGDLARAGVAQEAEARVVAQRVLLQTVDDIDGRLRGVLGEVVVGTDGEELELVVAGNGGAGGAAVAEVPTVEVEVFEAGEKVHLVGDDEDAALNQEA